MMTARRRRKMKKVVSVVIPALSAAMFRPVTVSRARIRKGFSFALVLLVLGLGLLSNKANAQPAEQCVSYRDYPVGTITANGHYMFDEHTRQSIRCGHTMFAASITLATSLWTFSRSRRMA
jgi:hypothetical protein